MSRPRGDRTGDENPASMTIFANRSIALLLLVSNGLVHDEVVAVLTEGST